MVGTFSSCRNNSRGKNTDKANALTQTIAKTTIPHEHSCLSTDMNMLAIGSLSGFNSLKFQVILFLRQKLVERYIGVDGVNFNALGHLDTGRHRDGKVVSQKYTLGEENIKGPESAQGGFKESGTIPLLSSAGV